LPFAGIGGIKVGAGDGQSRVDRMVGGGELRHRGRAGVPRADRSLQRSEDEWRRRASVRAESLPPDAGLAGGPGLSRRAWEDRHHQRLRNTGTVVKRGQGGHLIRDPERGGGGIGPCPITAPVMDAQELDND